MAVNATTVRSNAATIMFFIRFRFMLAVTIEHWQAYGGIKCRENEESQARSGFKDDI
jgi:hypothetical protein